MTDVAQECEAAMAALRARPSGPGSSGAATVVAGLLGPQALMLIWEGERLLWASPPAGNMARRIVGSDGRALPASQLAARLRDLGHGRAPVDGIRLERVRLGRGASAPTTLACRRIDVGGRQAVLTIVVGQVPADLLRPVPRGLAAPAEPGSVLSARAASGPIEEPSEAQAVTPLPATGRFTWQTDREGRFTAVSNSLVDLVGPEGARLVGRSWGEIVGDLVEDAGHAVASALDAHAPWRMSRVLWRVADGRRLMPVLMAGAPRRNASGDPDGFRGFGTWRAEDIEIRPPSLETQPALFDAHAESGTAAAPGPDEAAHGVGTSTSIASPTSEAGAELEAGGLNEALPSEPPAPSSSPDAESPDVEPGSGAATAYIPEIGDVLPEDRAATRGDPPDSPDPPQRASPAMAAPYKSAHALHPVFQVLLDASLSGLSHLIASLPEPAAQGRTRPPSPHPAAASAARGSTPPLQEPSRPEPADTVSDAPADPGTAENPSVGLHDTDRGGFGALNARIEGRLGPLRQVPLRLTPRPVMDPALPGVAPDPASDLSEPPGEEAPRSVAGDGVPVLSFSERGAFQEIARALGARLDEAPDISQRESADIIPMPLRRGEGGGMRFLEAVPAAILVHRGGALLFANRAFLALSGHADLASLAVAGGLSSLLNGEAASAGQDRPVTLVTARGETMALEARSSPIPWPDSHATLELVVAAGSPAPDLADAGRRLADAVAVLEIAGDGIVPVDALGRIVSLNGVAERLFGYDQREIAGEAINILFEAESHAAVHVALGAAFSGGGTAAASVMGRHRDGRTFPLGATLGLLGPSEDPRVVLVLREEPQLVRTQAALVRAVRASDTASRRASEFLARISHEVRSPMNAIVGFAEVMIEERFGPVGTERYAAYLADIRSSGVQVIRLVDDLLDLSRAMASGADTPAHAIDLNKVLSAAVNALQPLAARERIVLRTSFAPAVSPLALDARSVRRVFTNLLSNAIRFTPAGGQVIVSTATTESRDVAVRIRDTGVGMSEQEIADALDSLRHIPKTRRTEGRGLGLPIAKAIVEASRGILTLTSKPGEGTLVEVLFPCDEVSA